MFSFNSLCGLDDDIFPKGMFQYALVTQLFASELNNHNIAQVTQAYTQWITASPSNASNVTQAITQWITDTSPSGDANVTQTIWIVEVDLSPSNASEVTQTISDYINVVNKTNVTQSIVQSIIYDQGNASNVTQTLALVTVDTSIDSEADVAQTITQRDVRNASEVTQTIQIVSAEPDLKVGTIANRPSAGNMGLVYQCSDNFLLEFFDNGTTWDLYKPMYVPNANTWNEWSDANTPWTIGGAGSGTVTTVQTNYKEVVFWGQYNANNGIALAYYYKALDFSTPYTITLGIYPTMLGPYGSLPFLGLKESSSGKISTVGIQLSFSSNYGYYAAPTVDNWNSDTSFNATLGTQVGAGVVNVPVPGAMKLRIHNDGTTISYELSLDGVNYQVLATQGATAFGTPNEVVVGMQSQEGGYTGPPGGCYFLLYNEVDT